MLITSCLKFFLFLYYAFQFEPVSNECSSQIKIRQLLSVSHHSLTLSWRRSLSYRNSTLFCRENLWTGFYRRGTSVKKELNSRRFLTILTGKTRVFFNSAQEWLVGCFWLFHMFIQSIKFYYTFHYHVPKVQMIKKCYSSNRQ